MIRILDNQQGTVTLVAADDRKEPYGEKQKELLNVLPELQLLEISSLPQPTKNWSITHRLNRLKKVRRPSSKKSS